MLHVSYQLRIVWLYACCWKTQNCFQIIVSQLIASAKLIARMPISQLANMNDVPYFSYINVGLCGPLGD